MSDIDYAALVHAYQSAEAEVDWLARELEQAKVRRDAALGALRMAGKQWEGQR